MFFKEQLLNDRLSNALKVVQMERLIIDSKHLPLIESAENGNTLAMCILADAFADGSIKGIHKNYIMSAAYMQAIIDLNQEAKNYKGVVEATKNKGLLNCSFGYKKEAQEKYIEAIKIMANHIPAEEWDYEIQDLLLQVL